MAPLFLPACGGGPVVEKPSEKEIAGVWECSEYPADLLRGAGGAPGARTSRIVLQADGSGSASGFPERSPYRFTEVPAAPWSLVDPSRTPSGAWSVEFNGNYLQCRRTGGRLELRCLVSAVDDYKLHYHKVE